MSYFSPYVDGSGLHLPTYQDILDDMIASMKKIYGSDIYLGNDSADYQFLSILALKVADSYQAVRSSMVWISSNSSRGIEGSALAAALKASCLFMPLAVERAGAITAAAFIGKIGCRTGIHLPQTVFSAARFDHFCLLFQHYGSSGIKNASH